MKFYYDTEFHERGPEHVIDFISIGIIADSGETYYAVHEDFDFMAAMENDWLRRNVMGFLPLTEDQRFLDLSHPDVKPRWKIREEITTFILGKIEPEEGDKAELWADYADYDHVILSQIFGRMIDLPKGMPMYTRDLRQEIDRIGIPESDLPKPNPNFHHHALEDARYDRALHRRVIELGKSKYLEGYAWGSWQCPRNDPHCRFGTGMCDCAR